MKKIIFLLLSVVLSITTLWAQITPTSNNTTVQIIRVATVDTDGIIVVDVAEPDSNGLSNNTYSDFSTSNNLIIFNNSAVISTTQIKIEMLMLMQRISYFWKLVMLNHLKVLLQLF